MNRMCFQYYHSYILVWGQIVCALSSLHRMVVICSYINISYVHIETSHKRTVNIKNYHIASNFRVVNILFTLNVEMCESIHLYPSTTYTWLPYRVIFEGRQADLHQHFPYEHLGVVYQNACNAVYAMKWNKIFTQHL